MKPIYHEKKPYAVMVRSHEGNVMVLRYFSTLVAAENHHVGMSQWRDVWVVRVSPPSKATLRLPWQIEYGANGKFTYIRDADDNRILTLLGQQSRHPEIEQIMRDHGLLQ